MPCPCYVFSMFTPCPLHVHSMSMLFDHDVATRCPVHVQSVSFPCQFTPRACVLFHSMFIPWRFHLFSMLMPCLFRAHAAADLIVQCLVICRTRILRSIKMHLAQKHLEKPAEIYVTVSQSQGAHDWEGFVEQILQEQVAEVVRRAFQESRSSCAPWSRVSWKNMGRWPTAFFGRTTCWSVSSQRSSMCHFRSLRELTGSFSGMKEHTGNIDSHCGGECRQRKEAEATDEG